VTSFLHVDTAATWRGGQNQVLLTALGLHRRGHRVMLAVHAGGVLRKRAAGRIDIAPLTVRGEFDVRAGWRLARLIASTHPDVVHAHDPHAVAASVLALALGRFDRPPLLVAARRVDFHLRSNLLSRFKHRRVDLFIASSDAIRAMLLEDGVDPSRAVTVHEGVDVDLVASAPAADLRVELDWPADALVVGNVAALVPHKGQRYLVDAARLVVEQVPAARFVILGHGELGEALGRQVAELGLDGRVVLGGFSTDVPSVLKAFDVFAMSSVTEGLGTSLLDAMAAARPIVATSAGGIPEVVEDGVTGLLVPPGDTEALARALVRLLGDESLRGRMGRAGLARVRERFSADRMVEATLQAYSAARDRRTEAGRLRPADDRS
jgi:glycosyltransferase involved in cell wall biosynthesis